MRRLMAGTSWKMNNDAAATQRYAVELGAGLARIDTSSIDLFVLTPFTSLHAPAGGCLHKAGRPFR